MAEEERTNENKPSGCPNPEGEASSLPELSFELMEASKMLETSLDSESDIFLTKKYLDSSSQSSGVEYSPSKESSSEESSSEESVRLMKQRKPQRTYRGKTLPRTSSDKSMEAERPNSETILGDVSVMKLKRKKDGARDYSKRHYCLYCPLHCHKMARHLMRKHSSESAVAQAITFPLKSKERKLHFDLIRNKGNRAHNNEVLKAGSGTLIPSQQSGNQVKASDYMHCINCEALLKRKSLWRHMSRCKLAQKCKTTKPGKSRIQALCAYAQPVPDDVNKKLWELVNAMHQDEVTNIIREEKSILKLGEHLYAKHGHDKTKHDYIRQKMREIGRLILHSRKAGKLKRIEDFYVPSNFNFVIKAVQGVAGFNEDRNVYKIPSLALKLGHSLKKIADILECEAKMAESDNEELLKNLERSRGLYEKKWDVCVSSRALQTLKEGKWNNPQLLPFTEDVKKMHMYIDKCRPEYRSRLQEDPNKKNWSKLASLTLCEVILFNRRREGEVSKMPLSAFTLRNTSKVHSDVAHGLSELEQKLCQHFQRIEIRGKMNRKVPVLLTPVMLSSMEALVAQRRTCGVPDENPFFFSRPGAETRLRGSDAIRQIARECGAKHPETLSSTKLRKHVSTMSTVLNLKENEMDILANFLGHDIRVHRKYYRLPEGTLQLAKVSKVLMALEQGRLSEFKGMSLDEIQIDPNEVVPEAIESDRSETEVEKDLAFCSPSSSGTSSSKRRQHDSDSDAPTTGSSRSKKRQHDSDSDAPTTGSSRSTKRQRLDFGSDAPTTGSSRSKKRQHDSGSDAPTTGSSRSKKRQHDSDSDAPTTGSSSSKKRQHSDFGRDDSKKENSKKRTWSLKEVNAVEKTLVSFIKSGKVPGKSDCVTCIKASPEALKNRSWTAIKFYVKNRITAIQRECAKRT